MEALIGFKGEVLAAESGFEEEQYGWGYDLPEIGRMLYSDIKHEYRVVDLPADIDPQYYNYVNGEWKPNEKYLWWKLEQSGGMDEDMHDFVQGQMDAMGLSGEEEA